MSAGELVRRRIRRRLRTQQARRSGIEQKSTSLLLVLFAAVVITGAALIGAAAVTTTRYDDYASVVGDTDDVISLLPRGGSRIYDRNGTLLYEFANSGLRRAVPLADISPHMLEATVATEDASFWENNGINTRGLLRAVVENTPMARRLARGHRRLLDQPAARQEPVHPAGGAPRAVAGAQAQGDGDRGRAQPPLLEGADPRVVSQLDLVWRRVHRR